TSAALLRQPSSAKHELLFRHGVAFADLPAWQRRGAGLVYEAYEKEGFNPMTGEVVLARRRRVRIEGELPMAEAYAALLRDRLRAKGFLTPLGKGLYALVPVASMGVAAGDVAAYLDGLRRSGVRFYLGFDTAAGHYGWYPEAYGRVTLGVQALTRRALRTLD